MEPLQAQKVRFFSYSHRWLQHLAEFGRVLTFSTLTQGLKNCLLVQGHLHQHLLITGRVSQVLRRSAKWKGSITSVVESVPYWKGWQMHGTCVNYREGDTGIYRHFFLSSDNFSQASVFFIQELFTTEMHKLTPGPCFDD